MSYDLAVFVPEIAPRERVDFMAWYREKIRWAEDLDYDDPGNLDPSLEAYFHHLREGFPPMNGPFASEDLEDQRVTDFCCAHDLLYMGFSWKVAEEAHEAVRSLAIGEGVGFFDVSADNGEILFPDLKQPKPKGLLARLLRR